ncbi:MAG: putative metalloprotease CJM1_0395 family protein [Cellvibrionaceae bacterium]|nr:putative metalloprotease CJM1_0395 family protein [Cellvibrionaceae bacterium]
MISGPSNTSLANTVTPFDNTVVKPVGQANPEAQSSTIRPVEEPPKTEKNLRRGRSAELGPEPGREPSPESGADPAASREEARQGSGDLSSAELAQLQQLAARQRAVHSHEQAHASVGGELAGAPSYQYQTGPDGRPYAIAGEVPIRLSPVAGDPEATAANARKVQRAALAPLDPSPQDQLVAAKAAQLEQQALRELSQQQRSQNQGEREGRLAEAEAERLRDDKEQLEQELAELRQQQRASQAEIQRKSLELTQTLVGLDNINANKAPGQLIDSVS